MLDQLFDRDCQPVGWTDGQHVFDSDLTWVAFVTQGNAFSIEDLSWLGPVKGLSYQDRGGKAVAWNPAQPPLNSRVVPIPGRPMRPLAPAKPLATMAYAPNEPVAPVGGWSPLTFREWLEPSHKPVPP